MEIVEVNEKSTRIKNRKLSFDFNKEELDVLLKAINGRITREKASIEGGCEIENVYWKDVFDKLSLYGQINHALNEAVLKNTVFEITYECFDVLWCFLMEEKERLQGEFQKYSRFFLQKEACDYDVISGILDKYGKDADKATNKLYPKRKGIIEKLRDYIYESAYNGFFIPCQDEVSVHVPMREKEDILSFLDIACWPGNYRNFNIDVKGFTVEVPAMEIEKVCKKTIKALTDNFYSGSVFRLDIMEFSIFSYICHMDMFDIFD